ncbi:MAG: DUF2634 domain-containing protein [Bacillota bacterium]|nr:DUF2634 domain-containing protein [Bacillota bacterium]
MSLLPQYQVDSESLIKSSSYSTDLPIPKEFAWDFEKKDFIFENGKYKLVEGTEAIKIWIWKALSTQRYVFSAYSFDYGQEFQEIVGQGLTKEAMQSEAERCIKEALMINPYIDDIKDVSIEIFDGKVNVDFTVTTIYGEVAMSV